MEPWVLREAVSVIDAALKEDLGSGDLTTNACVPEDAAVRGRYIAKEDGVICGLALCALVFERLGGGVSFTALKKDGEAVKKGETAALVSGNARTILSGERVGLNLLQHLSGIATATARAVKAVSGTGARITDTRKTTPGLRALENYAVRAGGGEPCQPVLRGHHRRAGVVGLSDAEIQRYADDPSGAGRLAGGRAVPSASLWHVLGADGPCAGWPWLRAGLSLHHSFHARPFRRGSVAGHYRHTDGLRLCGHLPHAASVWPDCQPYQRFAAAAVSACASCNDGADA